MAVIPNKETSGPKLASEVSPGIEDGPLIPEKTSGVSVRIETIKTIGVTPYLYQIGNSDISRGKT
ncbi:hypothetical protein A3H26_03185 [candidate division WWE3 bacterium RIFCSPLOWO2_12_FULL_36_10]|uniref:Uncharacterized protein n=1 Tax=candidate division WWE3 bacterium RIFCSPLOWO2_12_FULL_36_10 TaxID=1802630 RepID=A0A1F4VG25_UNCKA|nr:MAG: hypothetical protein A3H26_03185 [candidate division WWE3 bacterium RIFCSPLOWO2_12_FULL_36_10]